MKIGVLSHQASDNVKKQGKSNDLIDRIRRTAFFEPIIAELDSLLEPSTFIGRAPQQVEKFVATEVAAALELYRKSLVSDVAELHV
jgi:adenylosuccinate lyase